MGANWEEVQMGASSWKEVQVGADGLKVAQMGANCRRVVQMGGVLYICFDASERKNDISCAWKSLLLDAF